MNAPTIAIAAGGFSHKKGAAPQRDPNGIDTMKSTAPTPIGQPQLSFIREGHVRFTPAQANLVLQFCRYTRQRDESRGRGHIATLAEYMRRGQWLEKSPIDFAMLDGRLILINGHHRMHAQIAAAKDIIWNVSIHDCSSDADVKGLYYRFDTTLRKRSVNNIIDGIGISDDLGLGKRFAASVWRAATVIARDLSLTQSNTAATKLPDEIVQIVHDYSSEAQWIFANYKKSPMFFQKRLETASSLCIALVTLKYQPDEAKSFWTGIYEDDGLRKGDPRKTLIADMANRKGTAGLQSALMIASAKAWNAHFSGRDLKIIKVINHPVDVAGTPFVVRP